ncbi:MAG: 3-demethylubiquinone-9 3-methyltransferase [Coriobacteriales bacterium]|jgi:hypothetical protein
MTARDETHAPARGQGSPDDGAFSVGSLPDSQVLPGEHGHGELQELVDALFATRIRATSLDLITQAEIRDVDPDTLEVVNLLPSGTYFRHQMVDQLNSIVTAHGWGTSLGTVG